MPYRQLCRAATQQPRRPQPWLSGPSRAVPSHRLWAGSGRHLFKLAGPRGDRSRGPFVPGLRRSSCRPGAAIERDHPGARHRTRLLGLANVEVKKWLMRQHPPEALRKATIIDRRDLQSPEKNRQRAPTQWCRTAACRAKLVRARSRHGSMPTAEALSHVRLGRLLARSCRVPRSPLAF